MLALLQTFVDAVVTTTATKLVEWCAERLQSPDPWWDVEVS